MKILKIFLLEFQNLSFKGTELRAHEIFRVPTKFEEKKEFQHGDLIKKLSIFRKNTNKKKGH